MNDTATTTAAPANEKRAPRGRTVSRRPAGGRDEKSAPGGRRPRKEDARHNEFEQKIITIRRVSRTVAGGRRFSFSVAMVIGDKKGRVGFGLGKAGDTALAIDKAIRSAKKNLVTIPRTKTHSIPHATGAKYSAAVIELRPAHGRGLVAGASARTVLEHAGITDVTSKLLARTKNQIAIARATIQALSLLEIKKS